MAPPKVPTAAEPKFGAYFDAWNSSSIGHQRAENRLGGSTGWRQSRSMKLSHQFRSGETGGKRISDTVGAGSKDWDEKLKGLVTPEVRERAKTSVQDMLMQPSKPSRTLTAEEQLMAKRKTEDDLKEEEKHSKKRRIFDGLVIYINGSTHPIISDHKLKHTLAENGARLSLHLGRRQVTHVILGRSSGLNSGAGGELSGTKMEKEIRRVCGCGVKYVGVEWVLESIKSGKRLSETGFLNLKVANKGQQSVYGMLNKSTTKSSSDEATI